MNYWRDLRSGPNPPEVIFGVVEIPRGSRNKYEYDKELGVFYLDRVLAIPFHYDCDYGFIPQTLCDDGGPLDVIILTDQPTFPGCVIPCKPVELMRMMDVDRVDDKVLAVPINDPKYSEVANLKDLRRSFMSSMHVINELTYFFNHYKDLEGKKTKVLEWKDSDYAKKRIMEAIALYEERHGSRRC